MAFPYIFADNFETGDSSRWTSETDLISYLDFPHYSTISSIWNLGAPYQGAYCMRQRLGNVLDAYLVSSSITIADTVTRYSAFNLYISKNFTASADDTFAIYELQGAASAVQNSVGLRSTASSGLVEIGVGNTAPTSFVGISKGQWHHICLVSDIQSGGTGSATLWLDGVSVASVSSLTNIAVSQGVLGCQDTLVTTGGHLLFSNFIFDDGHIYPTQRFPDVFPVTQSGHVFVGKGWIEGVSIMSTNGTLDLYDTDVGNTTAAPKKAELSTSSNYVSFDEPIYFERGCYVSLGGTNPRGEVRLVTHPKGRGIYGPTAWGSDGAIKEYGQKRTPRPGNV